MASRNFECLLDFDEKKNEKMDYWKQARLREEEYIKEIKYDNYIIRQAELEIDY